MLTYAFDNEGQEPLYQQLYRYIKEDIIQGVLEVDEKLPSKRSFAENLGISIMTVENAYAQLAAEGFIYSLPKKGFYVSDIKAVLPKRKEKAYIGKKQEQAEKGNWLADFTSNQTCSEQFPFSVWAKLMRKSLYENRQALMENAPCGGIWPLREALAGHLRDFRGMDVRPEQIIVGAGTEYLYGLLLQLLGMDKRYGVENPGYHKIYKIYKSHCVACSYVEMDGAGVKPSDLDKQQIDVVHISPSHHFPTGIVMPIGRRYELLGWAQGAEGRYIIEDDYDSEFRLCGKPIPSLQSIDVTEKVIYINTFTKTLSSTVRISYMVLPGQLLQRYYEMLSFYSCTVSNFEQYVLSHFISEGYFEKHINRMRNYYHEKRDILLKKIEKSPLSDYVTISEEDAGLHFLMQVRTALSDEGLCAELAGKGIRISSVGQYYAGDTNRAEHVFVMNYSSLEEDNIDKVIQIFYQAIRQ